MSYGEYSSDPVDLPIAERLIFFTSTDSVVTIAWRSLDLTSLTGNTVTIVLTGFIIPNDNNSGQVLGFYAVDEEGNFIELGLVITAVLDELIQELNVYPNPAIDRVNLEFSTSLTRQLNLSLVDLSGKQFLNRSLHINNGYNDLSIDLPEIPNGLYILNLQDAGGIRSIPLVIMK